jgi:hypothetical protein
VHGWIAIALCGVGAAVFALGIGRPIRR